MAIFRVLLLILLTTIIIPTCLFVRKFLPRYRFHAPRFFHRVICKILNVKIEVKGEISKYNPTLFVSNHMSYVDIPVLGSVLLGAFVSKSEIRTWPIIGLLATLQNTIFVQREKRRDAGNQANTISDRINSGDSIMVFPEGTTGSGTKVLKFKSSLFSIAKKKYKYNSSMEEEFIKVQPITISFDEINNAKVVYEERGLYSWIGDEALWPHMPKFIGLGKKKIVVTFHPVVSMSQFENRKKIAKYCEDVISKGLSDNISGLI